MASVVLLWLLRMPIHRESNVVAVPLWAIGYRVQHRQCLNLLGEWPLKEYLGRSMIALKDNQGESDVVT